MLVIALLEIVIEIIVFTMNISSYIRWNFLYFFTQLFMEGEIYGNFLWLSSLSPHQFLINMKIIIPYNKRWTNYEKESQSAGISQTPIWDIILLYFTHDATTILLCLFQFYVYIVIIHNYRRTQSFVFKLAFVGMNTIISWYKYIIQFYTSHLHRESR